MSKLYQTFYDLIKPSFPNLEMTDSGSLDPEQCMFDVFIPEYRLVHILMYSGMNEIEILNGCRILDRIRQDIKPDSWICLKHKNPKMNFSSNGEHKVFWFGTRYINDKDIWIITSLNPITERLNDFEIHTEDYCKEHYSSYVDGPGTEVVRAVTIDKSLSRLWELYFNYYYTERANNNLIETYKTIVV